MSTPKTVAVTVELTREEAWSLAQFVKRAHWGTAEALSDPSIPQEPQLMLNGLIAVQRGLNNAGFSPR